MKVVTSDNKIVIYSCKKEVEDINSYVKKLIFRLKKQYGINIFGFYQINVFKNSNVGMIIEIIKEDDIDFFEDFVDLKIKTYDNTDVYFAFNDYFFDKKKDIKIKDNNYYIDINTLSYKDFLFMTEICDYIYDSLISDIK